MVVEKVGTESTDSPMNVVVLGSGQPPLLILHGWGQSLEVMRPLGELFAKYREVHLIDLPGFGKSPKPVDDWDTNQYADRILRYCQEKKLENIDLLGHSFGGRISVRLAYKEPELLRSLILVNSHGIRIPQRFPKNIRAQLLKSASGWCKSTDKFFGSKIFESWFVPRYGSRDYKNAGEMKNILVKTVNEEVSPQAKEIKVPVLLLWGSEDAETPVAIGERFHELMRNSKLVILPGKDHYPFLSESAHLCAYHINNFLKSLPEAERVPVNA
jgi:pimeloyl-ACP methyl ester carboxylesterase